MHCKRGNCGREQEIMSKGNYATNGVLHQEGGWNKDHLAVA